VSFARGGCMSTLESSVRVVAVAAFTWIPSPTVGLFLSRATWMDGLSRQASGIAFYVVACAGHAGPTTTASLACAGHCTSFAESAPLCGGDRIIDRSRRECVPLVVRGECPHHVVAEVSVLVWWVSRGAAALACSVARSFPSGGRLRAHVCGVPGARC
jgi:hypothetical protein